MHEMVPHHLWDQTRRMLISAHRNDPKVDAGIPPERDSRWPVKKNGIPTGEHQKIIT